MEKKKTFKELFAGTGIEPTTNENGGVDYNFKATLTTQSKPQSEFVYVSSSQPSAIVMISTQYQNLSEKEKSEMLSKLNEWSYNEIKKLNKMNTPLENLKYYFRNDETITKEELLTAIDELIDNERAFFINAFEHGYASSGLVAIEENKAFEAYGKLYNACNP
jgi:polyribonucleotide nucleotidyltransferase